MNRLLVSDPVVKATEAVVARRMAGSADVDHAVIAIPGHWLAWVRDDDGTPLYLGAFLTEGAARLEVMDFHRAAVVAS